MSIIINTATPKKLRLFIASQWQGSPEPLRQSLPNTTDSPFRIKVIPAEQWHLTWAFLGQTRPEVIPAIQEILTQLAHKQHPIPVTLQSPIWWPHAKRATAIASVIQPVQPLQKLALELQEALSPIAKHTQLKVSHAFTPHLTIARLKPVSKHHRLNLNQIPLPIIPEQPWLIEAFGLYQSTLKTEGPEYHCLFHQNWMNV